MSKLRVGLVGCGFMGRMHGNVYSLMEQAELVAVCDYRDEKLAMYGEDFQVPQFKDLEQMIDDQGLDVVDICLPTHLHKDFTVRSARKGMHVFCEKPMALNLAEADEMIRECEAAGVQLFIGHCIRFWPEYAFLKQMAESGEYGDLLSVNLTRYGEFPSWSSSNWLADEALSGGGVLDMHIHDTDFALYLLGTPDEMISFGNIDERGPGHAFTTMRFGKAVAHLEGGWNLPTRTPFKMAFRAIFERGAAIMDGGPLTVYRPGQEPWIPEFPKMEAAGGGNISDLGGYYHETKYFIDCLLAGTPVETVTPQSSRESLRMVLEEIKQIKAKALA